MITCFRNYKGDEFKTLEGFEYIKLKEPLFTKNGKVFNSMLIDERPRLDFIPEDKDIVVNPVEKDVFTARETIREWCNYFRECCYCEDCRFYDDEAGCVFKTPKGKPYEWKKGSL